MTITISTSMTRRTKRILTMAGSALLAILVLVVLAACSASDSNGNTAESSDQGAISKAMITNQPPPFFPRSAYRGEMIEVQAIEALGSPTTSFFFPEGTTVVETAGGAAHFSAPPIKQCSSQGVPVPNTASLTNPLQGTGVSGVTGAIATDQMDPNGLYAPQTSSGTWVLCNQANGGTRFSYWEGPVFAETGTAVWSDTQGIVDVGSNALPVCTIMTAQDGDGTGITAGDTYYHCSDSTGKSINSSPVSGPGVTPAGTQSSKALAS